MIQIGLDIKGIEEVKAKLNPVRFNKIISRTLNKATDQAKTATTRKIRGDYNIKASRLKEAITVEKANSNKLQTAIITRGRPPGLQHYGARQTRKGVTVKVKNTSGRKIVKGAFITTKLTGVFMRQGKSRLPIKRLFGPSVIGMMKVAGIDEIKKTIRDKTQKIWEHELEWEMSKK